MKRQRWQHDHLDRNKLDGYGSEQLTEDVIKRDREFGNMRRDDENGNLVVSRLKGDISGHMPVIDLDVPHTYVPSQTQGHGHLFINVELSEEQYKKLLDVLVECKILGKGNRLQMDVDGFTAARMPEYKL